MSRQRLLGLGRVEVHHVMLAVARLWSLNGQDLMEPLSCLDVLVQSRFYVLKDWI